MATNEAEERDKMIIKEHSTFVKHDVWKAVPIHKVPKGANVLSSTWAMKPKANGDMRARLNAHEFEQLEGIHYNAHNLAAPVVLDMTIRIMLVLIIMANWATALLDVKGTFLNGMFRNREHLYMMVPQGFERFYPADVLLLLLKTICSLKQAAIQFWCELQKVFKFMGYKRNKADPCTAFKWNEEQEVRKAVKEMHLMFECKDLGMLDEYVGCKIKHKHNEGWMKLMQPVLLQSFGDEFELNQHGLMPHTPAETGS
eukprot:5342611-Ditylum_brightwellii.AAC.1